ncbi:MAG TPA: exopolysaccharide transport family protein [Roseiarcus sp.]|nr:exopolysaccharide transport family protein [Roseiarcus sp.]
MALSNKTSMRRARDARRRSGPLDLWDDGADPGASDLLSPMAVWLFLRRNAIFIALTTLVVAIVLAVLIRLAFNQYAATALVLVDPRDTKVTPTEAVVSNIGPDAIAVESLVQVAKSDGFLAALVDQEGLSKDSEFNGGFDTVENQRVAAVEKLKDKLAVSRRGATYVIDVTMKSKDAQESARLANAAAKMIVDNQVQLRAGSNQKAVDFIGGKLTDLRKRVEDEETAAAALKAELKITDAGPNGELLQDRRVAEINQQLVNAKARTAETRARLDQLRKAQGDGAMDLPAAPESTVLSALRQDYARLTRQAAQQEIVLGARHPAVAELKAQIADAKRQMLAEVERLTASAKTDYLEARQQEEALNDDLRKAQADSGAGDQDLVKLQQLERDAKTDRDVYEQLLARQRGLIENTGLASFDVRVVSQATPPLRVSAPGWSVILAASGLVGLLAALGGAFAREAMRRSLVTPAQTQRLVGVEVAGLIPMFSSPPPIDGRKASEETARAFSELCATASMKRAIRSGVVLVTSAREGEGKSTIAGNLAAQLASQGMETLLVQTGVAAETGARRRRGLAEVLAGRLSLQNAVQWRGSGEADLLAFGDAGSEGASESIEATGAPLRAIIRRCRRQFDVVVIDAPSAQKSKAPEFLAPLAGAILMIVEWDKTEAELVATAISRLESQAVSVVLNKVDPVRYAQFAADPIDKARLAA